MDRTSQRAASKEGGPPLDLLEPRGGDPHETREPCLSTGVRRRDPVGLLHLDRPAVLPARATHPDRGDRSMKGWSCSTSRCSATRKRERFGNADPAHAAHRYSWIKPAKTPRRLMVWPSPGALDRPEGGRGEAKPLVRPLLYVVVGVGPQDALQVPASADQHVVQTLRSDRPHEPLGEGVRPRCPNRSSDHPNALGGEDLVERPRELGVPVSDEEPDATQPILRWRGACEAPADAGGDRGAARRDRPVAERRHDVLPVPPGGVGSDLRRLVRLRQRLQLRLRR